jgi:hypothetical protein
VTAIGIRSVVKIPRDTGVRRRAWDASSGLDRGTRKCYSGWKFGKEQYIENRAAASGRSSSLFLVFFVNDTRAVAGPTRPCLVEKHPAWDAVIQPLSIVSVAIPLLAPLLPFRINPNVLIGVGVTGLGTMIWTAADAECKDRKLLEQPETSSGVPRVVPIPDVPTYVIVPDNKYPTVLLGPHDIDPLCSYSPAIHGP